MSIVENKLKHLEGLTEQERIVFFDLLESTMKTGDLDLSPIDRLYSVDYTEMPVSITKFISDDRYMGSVYNNGENIYPFWRKFMHDAFHNNPDKAWEILLQGAIGTGKSTIASLMMTYLLYRTLCLKDPQKFYGLTSNSPIVFVVLNLTLDLAYEGLYSMIVESIKLSPWFSERVEIRGKYNYSIEFPRNIQLMVGSNVQHTIGKNVLCLAGDTIIYTSEGERKIGELDGQMITAMSVDSEGRFEYSVPALVQKTGYRRSLVEITLRDGTKVRCTPEHRWMMPDYSYVETKDLVVGSKLLSWEPSTLVDIQTIEYDYDVPVYDVINAYPHNNFIVQTKTDYIISHNCAILDEMNFSTAPKGSKNSVMDMYRNIRRRMESRFLKAGRQPGMLFLVSSKNTDNDFLEQYANSVKFQPSTLVVDKAVYDIKPASTYLGPKFRVAVGDKTRASTICTDDDHAIELADNGYDLIEVPIEYLQAFKEDMNQALKEIAGLSVFSTSKLIPYAGRIEKCVDLHKPKPIHLETIMMGLHNPPDLRDYITDMDALNIDKHIERYVHIDIGLTGDKLGLAIVHPAKETVVEKYTSSGAIEKVAEMVYEEDLLLTIKAESGSEIPLYKVREFLFWLNTYAWKINLVTYDGFQSADSIQLLTTGGIVSKLQSVDRSDEPYLNLRSAILEERLIISNNSLLLRELYDLEYDRKNKKVDHPDVSWDGLPGSKDLADALAGAVYGAQQAYVASRGGRVKHREHFNRSLDNLKMLRELEREDDPYDYRWLMKGD